MLLFFVLFCDRKKDKYKADRIVQALEAGEWIQLNTRDVDAVVYCGDLNTEPGDLAHLVLTQMYQLNDTQGIPLTDFSFFNRPIFKLENRNRLTEYYFPS